MERRMGLPCGHLPRPLTKYFCVVLPHSQLRPCAREAGSCLSGLATPARGQRELANEQEGKGGWRWRRWHVHAWMWGAAWHFQEQLMAWHDQDVRCTERKVLGMLEPYSKQDNEGFSSAGIVSGSLKLVSILSAIIRKKVLVSC